MAINIARRKFIAAIGGTAATWPFAARSQQPKMQVIGFLHSASAAEYAHLVTAFRSGLKEVGYVEGQNVAIEYRWAEGEYERLTSLAADLITRKVDVIVATGGEPSALAAKAATSTVPIIFTSGGDPVKAGLVASLNRPGANATGVTLFTTTLLAKRLEYLHYLLPKMTTVNFLVNPNFRNTETDTKDLQEAARLLGSQMRILNARSDRDFDAAFAALAERPAEPLIIDAEPFFYAQRIKLVTLAAHYAVPVMYYLREFVSEGGLISYGSSLADSYRQIGVYAGRVLKGEKPGDLPVVQPTRFELVINLKTAKALGLEVPPTLLGLIDEAIE
jgi:putative tryptophan/tyrosine transport system substrate-binding protein